MNKAYCSISDLITIYLEREDVNSGILNIPHNLLYQDQIKLIEWIKEFEEVHETKPSKQIVFNSEYGSELTNTSDLESFPSSFVRECAIESAKESAIELLMVDYKNGDTNAIDEIIKIVNYNPNQNHVLKSIAEIDRESYYDLINNPVDTIDFGIHVVDQATYGFEQGWFAGLAAESGVGKTFLACLYACRVAMGGGRVLFLTQEMTQKAISNRMDAILAGFNTKLFRTKRQADMVHLKSLRPQVEKYWEMIKLMGGDILIPNMDYFSPAAVKNFVHEANKTEKPYDLIIIDGYNYMKGSSGGEQAQWQELAEISNQLNEIVKTENQRILITLQLNAGTSKDNQGRSKNLGAGDIGYSKKVFERFDVLMSAVNKEYINGYRQIEIGLMKVRDGNNTGATDILKVDHDTGKVYNAALNKQDDLSKSPILVRPVNHDVFNGSQSIFDYVDYLKKVKE